MDRWEMHALGYAWVWLVRMDWVEVWWMLLVLLTDVERKVWRVVV